MSVSFIKLSATGNDFVVIDHRQQRLSERRLPEFAREVCRPHTGVGADGVILLEWDEESDYRMRHYNPDGSRAEMCGNGARALAWLAHGRDLWQEEGTFRADDGLHSVAQGERGIGVSLTVGEEPVRVQLSDGTPGWRVNTGVPHVVLESRDVEGTEVHRLGRQYRNDPVFGEAGANVDFIEQRGRHLRVRTYERGVESETLSCGTGALASALIAREVYNLAFPLVLETNGGNLQITGEDSVWMLWGKVEEIYSGEMKLGGRIYQYFEQEN